MYVKPWRCRGIMIPPWSNKGKLFRLNRKLNIFLKVNIKISEVFFVDYDR